MEWSKAWLQEFHCHAQYLVLLESEEVDERRLSLAWLNWWKAACACREAASELERMSDPERMTHR